MRNFAAMTQTEVIGVAQAAEMLERSPRAIQRRIELGQLEATKLPGKTGAYVLERAYVEALAAQQKSKYSQTVSR